MDDMYIRRGGMPPPRRSRRRRILLLVLLVVAAAFAARHFRKGREKAEPAAPPAPEAPVPAPVTPAVSTNAPPVPVVPPAAPAGRPASTPPPPPPPAVPTPPVTPAVPRPGDAGVSTAGLEQDPALPTLAVAKRLWEAGDYGAAREKAFEALKKAVHPTVRRATETLLSRIHTELIMTPSPMEEKVDYTVQAGDSLALLAKKFHTTLDLIRKSNHIQGSIIRVGQRLRILNGTFAVTVDKSSNELVLALNGRFFKRYAVGTGKFQKTPVGVTKITDRIAQPTWWRPDGKAVPYGAPENVLGTHWLSLDIPGYGIHGTWEPETIGKQESAGCVRLLNQDIEELYELLPVGTEVTITD